MFAIQPRSALIIIIIGLSLQCTGGSAWAQPAAKPPATTEQVTRLRTEVSVDLITSASGGAVDAQRWAAILGRLGVTVQSRQLVDARPDIRERKQGTLRTVQVTALLSGGALIVPGRKFTADKEQALADWIRELQTYGAQGRPDGKPAFGLSPEQFGQLFHELESAITGKTEGQSFEGAIDALGLPKRMRPRYLADAQERLRSLPKQWTMPAELKGISRGTGTAILLAQAGLAFRPGRTPDGEIELQAVLLEEQGVWPIGWPLEKPPLQSMPALVETVPIEFEDAALSDVIAMASEQTEIPILSDRWRLTAKGLSLQELKVTQVPTKTLWSIVLARVTGPHAIIRELLIDEAGTPFVWITPMDPKRLNEREKQRDILTERKTKR